MAEVTLSDGSEVSFDLMKITIKQYRDLFNNEQDENAGDDTVARAAGMTLEELQALPFPDYKRVVNAFFKRSREPIADPN